MKNIKQQPQVAGPIAAKPQIMFRNARYVTARVHNEVPREVQLAMWNLIDGLGATGMQLDYLQIFHLVGQGHVQQINHSQEVPVFKNTCYLPLPKTITAKIYVIDDSYHSTMMFAEEY